MCVSIIKYYIALFQYFNLELGTYLGSSPHTDPDILPPGPESPADHFFHVDIIF
jgi:hypothetical protein